MAPAPKKSKFTLSSAAAGSNSRAGGSKAGSSSSKAMGKRAEPKVEQLSDLDEDAVDGLGLSADELELDDEELGGDDEFDLDADMASSDGGSGGEADTDDEIEEAGRAASKSKKTASA
jgi:hypothetical protein